MYRVLHIMGGADAGGISAVVLNYMKYIDKERYHFDFALTGNEPGMHGKEMMALGATYFPLPMKSRGIKNFQNELLALLKREEFDAVHVHESATSYVALQVAKKAGVKCRVAHAHTTYPTSTMRGELKRISGCVLNYYYATHVIGCGRLAGERVFGKINMKRKKALVLPNAVETDKFQFDAVTRQAVRQELGLDDECAVGLIGRLSPQKNHFFALKMFKIAHELNDKLVLILVGTGEDERGIREEIAANGMESYVKMLGRRSDVSRIYQGIDICILPSVWEGFPVVAVEAMASGLPVLLSNTITEELKFGSSVQYLPLIEEVWAKSLNQVSREVNADNRIKIGKEVAANGFDIKTTVQLLEKVYI